jgi:TetR/AcrR family fatty acid metabolism transcriptional regulator
VIKIKKELIRQAAIEVIAENGFHDATIDKIASKAGIAVGTIYNYFQKKEEILDYIFKVEYEKRVEFLMKLMQEDIHPLDKLREIMIMHFNELKNDPSLAKVILKERNFIEQDRINSIKKFEGLPGFIKQILEVGIDKGYIRKCNPEVLSIMLFGAIEAVMNHFLLVSKNEGPADIFEIAINEISDLLREGLAKKP